MTIHELDPIFKLGPIEMGRKSGRRVDGAPIEDRTFWRPFSSPSDGLLDPWHRVRIRTNGPDTVSARCVPECSLGVLILTKEQINHHPLTKNILRWTQAAE